MVIIMFVYLIAIFFVISRANQKVKQIKLSEGWPETAKDIRIADTDMLVKRYVCSPWWFCIHIGLILFSLVSMIVFYDKVPSRIAMQMDLSGNVTRYADKSMTAMLFPIIDPDNIELSKKRAKI